MSIFTKILLATEGSESSEIAVRTALDLSKRLDSEVHVIYVAHEHPTCMPTTTCATKRKKSTCGVKTSKH